MFKAEAGTEPGTLGIKGARLARLVAAWSELPEKTRRAIVQLAEHAGAQR